MASASLRLPRWLGWAGPLALVAVMAAALLALDPIGSLREVPPVESLSFERTVLRPGEIELRVRNDGPDPVTIAQVIVNDAYWAFDVGDATLGRLEATTLTVHYPWEPGLPVAVDVVTSTGLTIGHEIEAAALTPKADARTVVVYGLLGVYIGVLPIAIGLLWFPALRRASRRWLGFFLAFTVGLLAFLLVDTVVEGLELAGETGAALNGIALVAIGATGAVLVLTAVEDSLERRKQVSGGLMLAYLIAAGIGLHNMGEGLAVGAALAAGEVALGTFLVLGFALHNTTEGLAIVAPLGREEQRPSLGHFAGLGAVAGLPTIAGAWLGGFAFAPAAAALFFGVAAGAIAQVIFAIGRGMTGEASLRTWTGTAGFIAGLLVMYLTGLLTA
jgi:zinc transporter ZupT